MAVKIKLMRLGKMRAPYYRIIVADARTRRNGRVIETIGKYHPQEDPSFIEVDADRAAYWLSVGAQPTEPVTAILKVTGDWQKFKGEPAPPPMLVKEPKADRKAAFEAAAREGVEGGGGAATTPKKKAAPKADTKPTAEPGTTASDDQAPAGHAAPKADEPVTAEQPPAADAAPAPEAPSTDADTAAASPEGDAAPDADAAPEKA